MNAAANGVLFGIKFQPITIRLIIGRGWGQGQHTLKACSLGLHIPGLKVVMPSNARDAKA